MGIIKNLFNQFSKKVEDAAPPMSSQPEPPKCFNCNTYGDSHNPVKRKGGQTVCKICLRKARRMARSMV